MSFFSLNFMVLKHILVHMCVLIGTVSQVSNVAHCFLFYLLKAVNFGEKKFSYAGKKVFSHEEPHGNPYVELWTAGNTQRSRSEGLTGRTRETQI